MRKRLKFLRSIFTFGALAFCCGCALTSAVLGQTGSIRVIYYAPAWGPNTNGEEVVYFLKQVTFEAASAHENRIYLCSIKPDGSDRREIAWLWKDQPDQWIEPSASAATMEINAATKRAAIGVDEGQRSGVFVVGLDGKNFRSLWPKEWTEERPHHAGYPTWSPDGKWIAFHAHYDIPGYYAYRIAKFRDDGTGYELLTDGKGDNGLPAWSPKGDLIAYTNLRGQYLWLMKPDGSEKRNTTVFGMYARWSPNGKFILNEGTHVVDPLTGNIVRTTHVPAFPKWGSLGFLGSLPSGIDFTPPSETGTTNLLKNVHRSGGLSDLNTEKFRW